MTENVRLQNLRDFTVQIRDPETNEIKGTGIVISVDHVITCAHVVEAVLGVEAKDAADRKIGVYFPLFSSTETKIRHAIVTGCPFQHDDDIVALRLIDGLVPLGPEQIAVLGAADHSDGHTFLSYGYSPILEYQGTRANGQILGSVEPPVGKILHVDPIQISSQQIDHGMSGAGVLDTEINLVVGLIAARNFPKTWLKADIAFAVDAKVLTFDPFCFRLREEALPLRPAPVIRIDVPEAIASARKDPGLAWNNAPPSIQEWVGRADLLKSITNDWIDPTKRVTGLVGFGGEGKSSLARRWIDDLLSDTTFPQPDGIFWWGFYDRPSVDEFFEAALKYLSGGNADLSRLYQSSSARVHLLAGMLHGGRYLFILDGLEVLQHQEGDRFGLLKSNDLREFLQFFAAPNHNSFCLVTSRVPLLDMMEYTTYQHHDVERLSAADGRGLLLKLGVKGDDAELDKVVADWDGHALTLSLIGSYIADQYGGDISNIKDLPTPTAGEPRYKRVHRILMRCDEHLNDEERAFLKIFSAFRIPVDKTAFEYVFRAKKQEESDKTRAINAPIATLDDTAFDAMVKRLVDYRILRYDIRTGKYNIHPLIRSYYYCLMLSGDQSQAIDIHKRLKKYYLDKSSNIVNNPTLDDLKPLIEAVHHACQSKDYDEAIDIYHIIINRRNEAYLFHILGSYETELNILLEFFPDGDTLRDPLLNSQSKKIYILNQIGLCLKNLGQLDKAEQFLLRTAPISPETTIDFSEESAYYYNLSDIYLSMGALGKSEKYLRQALQSSIRAGNKEYKRNSIAGLAFSEHLQGNISSASVGFKTATDLEDEISLIANLYSRSGIWYAEHLIRIGNTIKAQEITKTNIQICILGQWIADVSCCYRIMGDLYASEKKYEIARKYYNKSLTIARNITHRQVLIEALLGIGKLAAKQFESASEAFSYLDEALIYATSGGYRLLEADIRVALAWAHIAAGNKEKAKAEAIYAKKMSEDMSYYWGKKDADDVLIEIEKASL